MAGIQLLHAGEEALIVLVPVAFLFLLEFRNRRREKARASAETTPESGSVPKEGLPPE